MIPSARDAEDREFKWHGNDDRENTTVAELLHQRRVCCGVDEAARVEDQARAWLPSGFEHMPAPLHLRLIGKCACLWERRIPGHACPHVETHRRDDQHCHERDSYQLQSLAHRDLT